MADNIYGKDSEFDTFFKKIPKLHRDFPPCCNTINKPGRALRGAFFAAVCLMAVFLAACGDPVTGEPAGDQGTYSISLSKSGTYAFPAASQGYTAVEALTVTVTNTGNRATGQLSAALSGTDAGSFTVSGSPIADIPAGGTGTFTVGPKPGLTMAEGTAKTYTTAVTVSGGNGITAGFTVSFTVRSFLTSVAAVADYLTGAEGGTTADNPVPLPVKLDAGDWTALLGAINTAGKYAALDLSASAMAGTEFDPGAADTGEKYIVSLVLPDAAESIKETSWENPLFRYFTNLKEVSGANIKTIGKYAFYRCTSLISVSFPEVISIGDSAFIVCTSLASVSFPEVISIGDSAFIVCTSLSAVNLPASLTSIVRNPFGGCVNLTTITVDSNNPQFTAREGILLDKAGTTVIAYPSASGTVTLSEITSIGGSAFYDCIGLTSVSFPEVTSIGRAAFSYCTGLITVSFPEATSIGDFAFDNCSNLISVSFPKATSIGHVAFQLCDNLASVSFPEATSIGEAAFALCSGLTSVSFPKVISIEQEAFGFTDETALTITMGIIPPTVGNSMFIDVNAKPVTVKVPASAVSGYDSAWRDAFKGKGSDGSGDVNTDIILTIEGF